MLKRYLTLMILFVFSSSLIYSANCYSSASVQNDASISIVGSEDALIAIPSSLTLITNTIETDMKNSTSENILSSSDTTIEMDIKNNTDENILNSSDTTMKTDIKNNASERVLTVIGYTIETYIKNNTNEKIWVKVDKGSMVSSGIPADPDFGVPIDAGEKISVTISLDSVDEINELIFYARWHGNDYTAEITSSINK